MKKVGGAIIASQCKTWTSMGGIFIYKRAIFIKHLKAFGQNFVFTKRFMCSHACPQPCVPCHSTLLALQLAVQSVPYSNVNFTKSCRKSKKVAIFWIDLLILGPHYPCSFLGKDFFLYWCKYVFFKTCSKNVNATIHA